MSVLFETRANFKEKGGNGEKIGEFVLLFGTSEFSF
jgi:hypothetical protein